MMKKLLAILLCLSLILALAACSKPESQTQQPAQQPAQTENQPTEPTQAEQPSEPEALTYPIEQFTVGTTAAIETATFGEYNFDMLASGVSELPARLARTRRAVTIRCLLPMKRRIPSHGSTPSSRA